MQEVIQASLALVQHHALLLMMMGMTWLLLFQKRRAVPTMMGFTLFALAIPILLLAFIHPLWNQVATYYNYLMLTLMLIDGMALSIAPRQIDLQRRLPNRLSIGQKQTLAIIVQNNSEQVLNGIISEVIPPYFLSASSNHTITIPAQAEIQVTMECTPTRRGHYTFNQLKLRYISRLKLLWITCQNTQPFNLEVSPDIKRMQQLRIKASKALHSGTVTRPSLGFEGTQFAGLRGYSAGDSLRKIAWRSTARLDKPVVRMFETEAEQPVLILLDASRKMLDTAGGLQKFDWAINTTLSLAAVALDRHDAVGLGIFNDKIVTQLPGTRGKSQLTRLLSTLSNAQAEAVEPLYESIFPYFARSFHQRGLIIVLTDLIDPLASQSLLRGLGHFSSQQVQLICTYSNPHLQRYTQTPFQNAEETYQKGVAFELLAQRQEALRSLSRSSAKSMVIDAAPDKLDEKLIEHYLHLKQGRLSLQHFPSGS